MIDNSEKYIIPLGEHVFESSGVRLCDHDKMVRLENLILLTVILSESKDERVGLLLPR